MRRREWCQGTLPSHDASLFRMKTVHKHLPILRSGCRSPGVAEAPAKKKTGSQNRLFVVRLQRPVAKKQEAKCTPVLPPFPLLLASPRMAAPSLLTSVILLQLPRACNLNRSMWWIGYRMTRDLYWAQAKRFEGKSHISRRTRSESWLVRSGMG